MLSLRKEQVRYRKNHKDNTPSDSEVRFGNSQKREDEVSKRQESDCDSKRSDSCLGHQLLLYPIGHPIGERNKKRDYSKYVHCDEKGDER